MWSTKKELGRLAKNWARGPNLKISEIGQSGRKLDFQEFLLGLAKIDIAWSFLDQLTQFLAQSKKIQISRLQNFRLTQLRGSLNRDRNFFAPKIFLGVKDGEFERTNSIDNLVEFG